jgi:pimeloyl-ACP methyl ester carboxylesterase
MIGRTMALASMLAQALIPGSRRIVIDDAGHLMQLEHPEEIAGLIADFVKKGR